MSDWNGHCQRCGTPSGTHIMSMFNTDLICSDCHTRERNHPKYAEAVRADHVAIAGGNFNFRGIGVPPELLVKIQGPPGEA